MRIQVVGDSPVVDELIGFLRLGGYVASKTDGIYSFHIDELKIPLCTVCRTVKSPVDYIIIDGVDCQLEQLATNYIQELGVPKIVLDRAGANKSDRRLEIKTPNTFTEAVSLGLYRAIDKMLNKSSEPTPVVKKKSKFFGLVSALLLAAGISSAQDQNSIIRFWNPTLDTIVAAGDVANNALRVNMVAGTISGADGSILDGVTPSIKATVFDYTNSNPLAVRLTDTNGDFIAGGGGTSSSFGSAFPATGTAIGFTDGTNMRQAYVYDGDTGAELEPILGVMLRSSAGPTSIEIGNALNPLYVRNDSTSCSSTITAISQTRSCGTNAGSTMVFEITGTWTGTIEFQIRTYSSGTYVAHNVVNRATGAIVSNTTANGIFITTGGWYEIALTSTAWSSGTASVELRADKGVSNIFISSPLPTGTNTIGAINLAQYTPVSGRLPVDGSGVTQPISAASLPLPTGAATSALQDGIIKDGTGDTTQANVSSGRLQVDGSGVTQPVSGTVTVTATNLDVQIGGSDSLTIGTFPDNEPFNLAQVAGATVATGNGTAAGSIRVSVASDSTGQIAVASLPNEGQQTAANSISVTPDTDNDAIGATGAAPPGEVVDVGGRTSGADTTGLMTALTICTDHVAVDIVTATTTLVVTGVANRHVRICAINLVSAGANNVALIAGTGATCGTSTAGINGGVTAAEGWNFAANGGISQGSGIGEIMSTKVSGGATGDSVCIITSAAVQLSGTISYAIY